MAGELCGRGCGWYGRCDSEPDYLCDCGHPDCHGDCGESDVNQDGLSDDVEAA
jgi:hypothetical protein